MTDTLDSARRAFVAVDDIGRTELDRLAGEYLATCGPIDLVDLDFSAHTKVAKLLSADGMDRASDVRGQVLRELSSLECAESEFVARDQLYEWVYAENELLESGEKYRHLGEIEGPYYRLVQAMKSYAVVKPTDWPAVLQGLESLTAALQNHAESLKRGLDEGILATQHEAELTCQRHRSASVGSGKWLMQAASSGSGMSLQEESRFTGAVTEMLTAASDLADFMEQQYLPQTRQQSGIGRQRYALWSRRILGEDVDLEQLYDSLWHELAETQAKLASLGSVMSGGAAIQDLIWTFESSLDTEVDAADGLRRWALETALREARVVNDELVRLPEGALKLTLADGGHALANMLEVLPPSSDGKRGGVLLQRTLDNFRISTWSLMPLIHQHTFPGEHLFNCFLVDPATHLKDFQRVLVNRSAISGWMNYSMHLAAYETERESDMYQLNVLRFQMRDLICALGDIGAALGLTIPDHVADFAGEMWTEEVFAQTIVRWAYIPREFATRIVAKCIMNPGYAIGPIVGARLRKDALASARGTAGSTFDIRAYHDRVLRLAPTGMPGMRAQLESVSSTPLNQS